MRNRKTGKVSRKMRAEKEANSYTKNVVFLLKFSY